MRDLRRLVVRGPDNAATELEFIEAETMTLAETVGLDVAFWFMQDSSYATKLINRFNAGVPVRVLVDPRANPTYAGNEDVLNMLRDAGIPAIVIAGNHSTPRTPRYGKSELAQSSSTGSIPALTCASSFDCVRMSIG